MQVQMSSSLVPFETLILSTKDLTITYGHLFSGLLLNGFEPLQVVPHDLMIQNCFFCFFLSEKPKNSLQNRKQNNNCFEVKVRLYTEVVYDKEVQEQWCQIYITLGPDINSLVSNRA